MSFLGSTTNFVAKSTFAKRFEMGFFDLTLGGTILAAVISLYCVVFAPSMLGSKPGEGEAAEDVAVKKGPLAGSTNSYNVQLVVEAGGPLVGQTLKAIGLNRIKGVQNVRIAGSGSDALKSNDTIQVSATAEGVAALRRVRGMELANEQNELSMLGARRRQRRIMEAAISEELVGKKIDVIEMRQTLQCGIISLRRSSPTPFVNTLDGQLFQAGDVLLLEGFINCVGSNAWVQNFGVVRVIDGSTPGRSGRNPDSLRAIACVCGLGTVIGLTMSGSALPMSTTCAFLLVFLVVIKAVDVKEAYKAGKPGMLLTVVCALGLGDAVQNTGLAKYLAQLICDSCAPMGKHAVLMGLYLAAAFLGLFVTNAALIAIVGDIGIQVSEILGIPVTEVALVVTYASASCFMGPYSYTTNLLVLPLGKYTWGDFVKFGGPLQFLHMIVAVIIAPFCGSFIGN
jgi:di/tricarboxylate transporter